MSDWTTSRSGLLVPRAEPKRWLQCEIPGCGKQFPMTQRPQFERHVKACLRRNGDALEAHVARREEMHGDADFDQEYYAYLRAGGR